jgi:hypothetical protein
MLERLTRDKHSYSLGPLKSYKENKVFKYGPRACIHNNYFLNKLKIVTHRHIKLAGPNTLVYWVHSYVIRIMKCCE